MSLSDAVSPDALRKGAVTWKSGFWCLNFIIPTASALLLLKRTASQCQRGGLLLLQLGLMQTDMNAGPAEELFLEQ